MKIYSGKESIGFLLINVRRILMSVCEVHFFFEDYDIKNTNAS